MNKDHGLTAENLLAVFPSALRNDKSMRALASSIANILATRPSEIDTLRIYANIDALPEEMLDILAYDFKVDWWDYDYSLEEKRQTLKDSWKVHRMLGTKAAVETAISAIYPDTTVEEWFEYGGDPYAFRLIIDAADRSVDAERHKRVLEMVNYYKNLRSHLDGITIDATAIPSPTLYTAGHFATWTTTVLPVLEVQITYLTDENGMILTDETGAILIDAEEG